MYASMAPCAVPGIEEVCDECDERWILVDFEECGIEGCDVKIGVRASKNADSSR